MIAIRERKHLRCLWCIFATLWAGAPAGLQAEQPNTFGLEPGSSVPAPNNCDSPIGSDSEFNGTLSERYQQGVSAFNCGHYDVTAHVFQQLYTQLEPSRERAIVAYALGQSYRYLGEFTSALYYYMASHREYAQNSKPDTASALVANSTIVASNLAVVEIRGWRSPQPAHRFHSLKVDGHDAVRLNADELRTFLGALDAAEVGFHKRHSGLIDALQSGFLASSAVPKASKAIAGLTDFEGQTLRLVVSRNRSHTVELGRDVGRDSRAARIQISPEELMDGRHVVELWMEPATLKLNLAFPTDVVPQAESIRAWVVGAQRKAIDTNSATLKPGGYTLFVEAPGLRRSVSKLELLPGEALEKPIKLDKPPERPPILEAVLIGGGVLVLGVVSTVLIVRASNRPHEPVRAGSLGWVIEVPP